MPEKLRKPEALFFRRDGETRHCAKESCLCRGLFGGVFCLLDELLGVLFGSDGAVDVDFIGVFERGDDKSDFFARNGDETAGDRGETALFVDRYFCAAGADRGKGGRLLPQLPR